MSDNALKISMGESINARARSKVLQHIQLMSGRAPASLVSTDDSNTIATINFETTTDQYSLPQIQIPIHGSQYERRPWQKGDKGFVGQCDLDPGNMSGLSSQTQAPFARPANLSSLIWFPIGNKNYTATDDKNAHLTYGPNGTIARDANKKSQVKTHPTQGATIQGGGDGNGNFPHSSTAGPDKVQHQSPSQVQTSAPVHNVTGSQNVAQDHNVGGNANISGLLSAASAAMGSMSFGSGGSSDSSGNIAAPSVSADTIVTRKLFTIAAGPNQLPAASAALEGARAIVIDSTTVTFNALVGTGGGTNIVPVFCTGAAWRVG